MPGEQFQRRLDMPPLPGGENRSRRALEGLNVRGSASYGNWQNPINHIETGIDNIELILTRLSPALAVPSEVEAATEPEMMLRNRQK